MVSTRLSCTFQLLILRKEMRICYIDEFFLALFCEAVVRCDVLHLVLHISYCILDLTVYYYL
jgi:hypothetical protein